MYFPSLLFSIICMRLTHQLCVNGSLPHTPGYGHVGCFWVRVITSQVALNCFCEDVCFLFSWVMASCIWLTLMVGMDLTPQATVLPLFSRVTGFFFFFLTIPQRAHENFLPHLFPNTWDSQSFYDSHSSECSGYTVRAETLDLSWVGGGRGKRQRMELGSRQKLNSCPGMTLRAEWRENRHR